MAAPEDAQKVLIAGLAAYVGLRQRAGDEQRPASRRDQRSGSSSSSFTMKSIATHAHIHWPGCQFDV